MRLVAIAMDGVNASAAISSLNSENTLSRSRSSPLDLRPISVTSTPPRSSPDSVSSCMSSPLRASPRSSSDCPNMTSHSASSSGLS
eukprot:CAMPEP_0173388082 /NCGR_PEP_ID=MMETSP1356-20130122/10474_1 /TAXON_ID=77927 ORGANISM="Hemiselmis virescens, Strain PCC157" /NCGR_SAMPLE_ID=MMETSP1356 /ASSEMBLY_ACC=CAM_ASM_000847 /LENGTH=85 /DNA_ID=CAMNT_0014344897 /DNA_START=100 /DNA_END=353 /DNA_ORIENTATION=+